VFNNPRLSDDVRLPKPKQIFESAAAHSPYNAHARFALACYWQEMGHQAYFRNELEARLRVKPDHKRAAAALATLDQHESQAASAKPVSKLPFGLGRIFGRHTSA
jgi:hypothetical protein